MIVIVFYLVSTLTCVGAFLRIHPYSCRAFNVLSPLSPPAGAQSSDVLDLSAGLLGGLISVLGSIPGSIIIDEVLQKGDERIKTIANLEIKDDLGSVFAYIARPASESKLGLKRPVVFLVHQFFGLRRRDTELADELARLGYIAVCPDCYQANTTPLIPRAISLVKNAAFNNDWELPLRDLKRVLDFIVNNEEQADITRMALSGFCFGGGVALRFADIYPAYRFKAVGVFYGKPIKSITSLAAPVYGVFGDRDRQFGPAMVAEFESLLSSRAIPVEIRRYQDQAHAFIEDLACIRRGGDALDAWDGWLRFLSVRFADSDV